MKTQEIILLPHIDEFVNRALSVIKNGNAAVIYGEAGAGVSTICARACNSWDSEKHGPYFRIPPFHDSDSLKMTQHIALHLLGKSMPSDYRVHNLSILWSLISEKIQKGGIGMVVCDRADLPGAEFRESIMTMSAECRMAGCPVGILMGMRQPEQRTLFQEPFATGLAFTGKIEPLSAKHVLAAMKGLKTQVGSLTEGIQKNDPVSYNALEALTQLSGGKICRLVLFSSYVTANNIPIPTVTDKLEKLWRTAFSQLSETR